MPSAALLHSSIIGAILAPALLLSACSGQSECKPACISPKVCVKGACAAASGDGGAGSGGDGSTHDGALGSDGGGSVDVQPLPSIVRIDVIPTSTALRSVNGSMPSAHFVVSAAYSDGSSAPIASPDLTVDPLLLGQFDRAGKFTANGHYGGIGHVIAHVGGMEGSAEVIVTLETEIVLPGTPTTAPGLFGGAMTDPTREASIVYPLDGAVMPQNVAPAEIQWLRADANDIFRITLTKPHVTAAIFEAQASPGFKDSLVPDLDTWRRVAESEPDETAEITVNRWVAATRQAIQGTPVRVKFAKAALLGSIYYWDIARGRIVRINDGSTMRDEFLPSPPQGCVGCHAVSPSGRYMAGRFGGGENVAGVFDLTRDLTVNPPPTLFSVTSTTIHWWFSTWSPDETRLLVSTNEGNPGQRAFQLVDPYRGMSIAPADGTLPTGQVTHPAWAPDGTAIAYVGNANDWGGNNTSGDIYLLPVTGHDRFGPPVRVVTGSTAMGMPTGNAASYPSWTPDSARIAFAHGTSSRSENGQSALYFVARDGSGLVRMDKASGGPDTADNFQPRFSPFQQDGYFWLSFLSRRDYGNAQAGTAGTSRQQIWVTAIKIGAAKGTDPSEVPFWLPGQNPGSQNISAYWAPRACRADHQPCAVHAECCSGDCQPDGCAPMTGACKQVGESCTMNEQCCGGVLCVDSKCGGL